MRQGQSDAVVRHLRRLAGKPLTQCTDAQLLQQFVARRGEEAFASLLRRHGGLIRTVCRHILHRGEDVEDALQATLLILAPAVALAEGVLNAMFAAKLKLAVVLFVMLVSIATGMGLVAQQVFAGKPTKAEEPEGLQLARGGVQPRSEKTTPVPRDQFGDPLPPDVLARLGTVRLRHAGSQIEFVGFSPDGQMLISASQDGMARLWEVATGKEIRHFQTRREPAKETIHGSYFALSRDCSFLASATKGGSAADAQDLCIWDLATGKERLSLKNPGYPFQGRIAISPDGKLLAWAGHQDAVSLWDVNTGRMLRRVHDIVRGVYAHDPTALAFSLDSRTLVVGKQSDRTIQLLDTATGTERRRFQLPSSPGTEGKAANTHDIITDLAFSPNGKALAGLQRAGKISVNAFLWDVSTGRELHHTSLLPWSFRAYDLAFSPDGKMLAFGCTPSPVRLLDSATFQPLREFPSGKDFAPCVAFSPDGHTLAVGVNSTVRLWDIATGQERLSDLGHAAGLDGCSLLPDQRHLVTAAGDGTIRRWDLATGRELSRANLPPNSYDIVLSPNGSTAVCHHPQPGNREDLGLWDMATGKERVLLRGVWLVSAFFSPDGKTLLTPYFDLKEKGSKLQVWDVATGKEQGALPGNTTGLRLAFSPDGKILTTPGGSKQNAILLLDRATGQELGRIPRKKNFDFLFRSSPFPPMASS